MNFGTLPQRPTAIKKAREISNRSIVTIEPLVGRPGLAKGILKPEQGQPGYVVAIEPISRGIVATGSLSTLAHDLETRTSLAHPHVVRLIGFSEDGDKLLRVFEYCEHGTLNQYAGVNILSLRQSLQLAADIADGMAYMHSRGIVHCDLRGQNISIDSERRAKVMPSCLSRVLEGRSSFVAHDMTVHVRWSAPEVLERHTFSEQSDIWSFGVLLQEIWAHGIEPFEDLLERQIRDLIIHKQSGPLLSCLESCPPAVYDVMLDCWKPLDSRPRLQNCVPILREMEKTMQPDFVRKSALFEPFTSGTTVSVPSAEKMTDV